MRYIVIPEEQELANVSQGGKPVTYGFIDLLVEFVYPAPVWRDGSRDNVDAILELQKLFADAKPGDVVAMTDELYEKFAPVATLRGSELKPHVATELNTLMRAVICASSENPKGNGASDEERKPAEA